MKSKIYSIFLLISIGIFLVSLYAAIIQVFGIESDDRATILGGVLSMVGGAVGAMGAYMVARHQVNEEKDNEKINLLSSELPIYVGLTLEFNKIILNLELLEKQKKSVWKNQQNDDFFEELKIRFDSIKWDRWLDTKKITDSILLNQLLFFEESFKRITEVMEYDIKKNRQKAILLYNDNNTEDAVALTKEVEWYKKEKEKYFYESYYCLQKAIKIQKVVSSKIFTIEKLIEGEFEIKNYQFFSSKNDFKIERTDGVVDPINITYT